MCALSIHLAGVPQCRPQALHLSSSIFEICSSSFCCASLLLQGNLQLLNSWGTSRELCGGVSTLSSLPFEVKLDCLQLPVSIQTCPLLLHTINQFEYVADILVSCWLLLWVPCGDMLCGHLEGTKLSMETGRDQIVGIALRARSLETSTPGTSHHPEDSTRLWNSHQAP